MQLKNYKILPFNFKKIDDDKYLLINQSGEFLPLSCENFNDLKSGTLLNTNDVYKKLIAKHFISKSEEDINLAIDLLATKLRTRKAFLSNFTALHMIVTTLRCNCKCTYCHASSVDINKQKFDMTWDIAKKTVDTIFQTPCPVIKIEFQGGEPLLNWEIIEETVLYAKFLNKLVNKRLDFIVCTNLLEINTKQLKFFKKHNIQISTSLDGLKKHHDFHRKNVYNTSSYDAFIKNLDMARTELGHDSCSALLTITKDNLNDLKEIIDHYVELGFHSIFLRALNPYGNAIKNSKELAYSNDEFIEAYKDALQYIINLNINGKTFLESYTTLILSRILTPFSTGFVDLQSPSGAGISGVIYDYNGEVYPADEARMLSRMGDKKFCMGNVLKDSYKDMFNGAVIRDIVKNSCVETMPICADCAYQQYCGADPIRNYLETNDIIGNRLTSGFCHKNKAVIDYLFSIILENDKDVMNVFWSWINRKSLKEIQLENI